VSQKLQFSCRYVLNRMCVDPTSRILPMLTAGLQKFTAAFLLRRKTPETYFFRLKNSHFTKFTAKCMAESVNSLSQWKKSGICTLQQLLVKPDQYKSAQTDVIRPIRKTVCCRAQNATRCSFCSDSMDRLVWIE